MSSLEAAVRCIQADSLVWGASRLVPIGFGVQKLQINLFVEDEKASVTELQEQILLPCRSYDCATNDGLKCSTADDGRNVVLRRWDC
jgi:hypothetical protein